MSGIRNLVSKQLPTADSFGYKKLVNHGSSVKIVLEEEARTLCISNNINSQEPPRISGHVLVNFLTQHHDVQDIKLRFVGGVVSRSKAKGPATDNSKQVFVGSERLFDKTVQLSTQSHFEQGKHKFPFQLSLPSQLPPSFKTDLVQVEYMLVAVVGFQNGCCGLIPILQKDPLRDRSEIQVTVTGLHASFPQQIRKTLKELNDADSEDENQLEMGIIEDCLCVFPADSSFMIQMNPVQSIFHNFPMSIQKPLSTKISRLSFSVWEKCTYRYHVEYHKHKPVQEEHINEKLLAMGEIDVSDCEILTATELEHNILLTLPVLESPGWLENVSQDLQTNPATIVHFLKMHVCMERDDQVVEFNLKIPVQLADNLVSSESLSTVTLIGQEEECKENVDLSHRRVSVI